MTLSKTSYPMPEREAERLNTLRGYSILDTHPEEKFDDLTRLAALICDSPIAFLSLVDEHRQWFKSRIGIEACQTARRDAFCAHTIMSDEVFLVPDASLDVRFSSNPLVVDQPYVRFYAGAPLVAANGHRLGALCVMDRVPRQLSPAQLEALRALSRQVMAQVTLGKSLEELRATLKTRDALESDLEKLIEDLQAANSMIHQLKGLVPVCAWCKKVRDDQGFWEQVEHYITRSTGSDITSALCPDCLAKHVENSQSAQKKG